MKHIFSILFIFTAQLTMGQVYSGASAEKLAPKAQVLRLNEQTKTPAFIQLQSGYRMDVPNAVAYTKQLLKNEKVDFELRDIEKTNDQDVTYRYYQTINSYPVEFSSWLIHVKNGRVYSMNGDITDDKEVDTTFKLSEEEALKIAVDYMQTEEYVWENGEKILVPNNQFFHNSQLRAAYKFNIFSKKPFDRKMVYVDAQTGKVLFDLPLILHIDVVGTAETQYSGTREINTEFVNEQYILKDNTRGKGIHTLNLQNNTYFNLSQAIEFTDDDNYWNNVNEQLDEYATDAHFGAMQVYDYYFQVHNRNSIDNKGYELRSYVHCTEEIGKSWGNAGWTSREMIYGDGDDTGNTPFTAIDVCGHEITHGLIQFTADFIPVSEPGALHEGFSDIFGTAVDFFTNQANATWTIDLIHGQAYRSLMNPKDFQNPDTYLGEYWYSGAGDWGGVHTNCGPIGYWFYLVSEGGDGVNDLGYEYSISGIGMDKAEKITYKLLTEYLSPQSGYWDCFFYGIQATADIYGIDSPEYIVVYNAFYAIGIILQPYGELSANFITTSNTENCSAPLQVKFTNRSTYNVNQYLWEFGDGNTSTEENPVHTYTELGSYDVKLTVTDEKGETASEIQEGLVRIDASLPCIYTMEVNQTMIIESGQGSIIYDTGGPYDNYADQSYSVITLHAPQKCNIALTIEEMEIEYAPNCEYDYLAFYDGADTNAPLINRLYCGTLYDPETIISTGEYVTMVLHADDILNESGFKIVYNAVNCDNSAIDNPVLKHISISPNPSQGFFEIQGLDISTHWAASISNAFGQIVWKNNPLQSRRIDLTAMPNGIYFLNLADANNQGIVFKLIKTK
jgi:Zn-dependent metalloprotease